MSSPRPAVADYVAAAFPGARITPIAGDASTRRFFRVFPAEGPSRVLMDYGDAFEDETDDVRMTRVFLDAGLPVASILDVDARAGCLLLEDLGSTTLESALTRDRFDRAVELAARVAVDGTAALRRAQGAGPAPALDAERFRFEMNYFLEHYVRRLLGRRGVPRGLAHGLHELADRAADCPRPVLCHRDFHSRNLMVRDDGSLAMVDIQDARWGPDGYDLASLLHDPYVDIDADWIDPSIERYVSLLEPAPDGAFRARLEVVAAQRLIKALGTYGFQIEERGAHRYASAIPRALERLDRLLPRLPDAGLLDGLLREAHLLDAP